MTRNTAFITALILALAPLAALAETPAEKGLRIAEEADADQSGFGDTETTLTMVLRNRHGEESVRHFRTKTLEVDDDGDKSISIFDQPADIKGTAVLTYSHKVGTDDQWLYLPALARVKRISSKNKSGSFVGSEFAYEDLSSQEVEKYTYEWLADEPCPGVEAETCWLIERTPVELADERIRLFGQHALLGEFGLVHAGQVAKFDLLAPTSQGFGETAADQGHQVVGHAPAGEIEPSRQFRSRQSGLCGQR